MAVVGGWVAAVMGRWWWWVPINKCRTQSNDLPRLCIHSSRLNCEYLKPVVNGEW